MLLDLIDEHLGAFEYDWRARFHLPLACVPESMDWGEAFRLFELLASDPSTQVSAALSGWEYPIERTDVTLRRLYDLQHKSKAGKRTTKPFPMPWDVKPKHIGVGSSMTVGEFRALKAANTDPDPQKRDALGRFAAKSKELPHG